MDALVQCNKAKKHLDELYNWTKGSAEVKDLLKDLNTQLTYGNPCSQLHNGNSASRWQTTERTGWVKHKREVPTLELFDSSGALDDNDQAILQQALNLTLKRDAAKKARDAVIHELYRSDMQEAAHKMVAASTNMSDAGGIASDEPATEGNDDGSGQTGVATECVRGEPLDANNTAGVAAVDISSDGINRIDAICGTNCADDEHVQPDDDPDAIENDDELIVSATIRVGGFSVSSFGAAQRAALATAMSQVMGLAGEEMVCIGRVIAASSSGATGTAAGLGGVDVDVECVVPARPTAPASVDADAVLAARAATQRRKEGRAAALEGRLDNLRGESSTLLDALTDALDPRATAARDAASVRRTASGSKGAVPANLSVVVLQKTPRTGLPSGTDSEGVSGSALDASALKRGWALISTLRASPLDDPDDESEKEESKNAFAKLAASALSAAARPITPGLDPKSMSLVQKRAVAIMSKKAQQQASSSLVRPLSGRRMRTHRRSASVTSSRCSTSSRPMTASSIAPFSENPAFATDSAAAGKNVLVRPSSSRARSRQSRTPRSRASQRLVRGTVRPSTSSDAKRLSGPLHDRSTLARSKLAVGLPPSKCLHLDGVIFNIPGNDVSVGFRTMNKSGDLLGYTASYEFDPEMQRDTRERATDKEWNLKTDAERQYQEAKIRWMRQAGGMR